MPAKNSISKFHGRFTFIGKPLWKKYKKENKSNISYADFKLIISASIGEINKWVMKEPIGFQLPGIGHMAVNKFKTFGTFKCYRNGQAVINHNLHTGGTTYRIQYFKNSRNYKTRLPYWFFKACRTSNRTLAKVLNSETRPHFNSFMQDQFIQKLPR